MNGVSSIHGGFRLVALPLEVPGRGVVQSRTGSVASPVLDDTVELSSASTSLADVLGPIVSRLDRLARIRAEIETGTYETPKRLNATVDKLLEELSR